MFWIALPLTVAVILPPLFWVRRMLVLAMVPSSAMLSNRLFSTVAMCVAPEPTRTPRLFSADTLTVPAVKCRAFWKKFRSAASGPPMVLVSVPVVAAAVPPAATVSACTSRFSKIEPFTSSVMFDVPVFEKQNIVASLSELFIVLFLNSNSVMFVLMLFT